MPAAPDPIFSRVRSALRKVNERSEVQAQAMAAYSAAVQGIASAQRTGLMPEPHESLPPVQQLASPEDVQAEALEIFKANAQEVAAQAASSPEAYPAVQEVQVFQWGASAEAQAAGTAYPTSPLDNHGFSAQDLDEMIAQAQPAPQSQTQSDVASSVAASSTTRRTTTARARGAALGREKTSALRSLTAEKSTSAAELGQKAPSRQQAASRSPAPRGTAGTRRAATPQPNGGGAASAGATASSRASATRKSDSKSDSKYSTDDVRKFLQGSGSGSLRSRKWA